MPSIPDGWFEFKNTSGSTIPARGIFVPSGITAVQDGRIVLTGAQPSTYGDVGTCFVNSALPVLNNKYGICTRFGIGGGPIAIAYDSGSGTPTFGASWGPISGSFKLSKLSQGWTCLSGVLNSTLGTALFVSSPMLTVRGKVASDVSAGSSGTLTVWTGAFGSEATTSLTISSVQNNSSCTVKSGQLCTAKYVPDNQGWEFFIAKTS